jgi:DNA-binding CsgD family transcriptional regulator
MRSGAECKRRYANLGSLTRREMQIMDCIKEGFSSRKIGVDLNIAIRTVEAHRHNILKKL